MNTLVFGNFRLCDGCSKGVHTDHRPVNCQCDLPGCEETA